MGNSIGDLVIIKKTSMYKTIDIDCKWDVISSNGSSLWFKGYLLNITTAKVFNQLLKIFTERGSPKLAITNFLIELDGHFAFIWQNQDVTLVAVDKICSIPIYYNNIKNKYVISSNAQRLKDNFSTGLKFDTEALLEVSMSGYTIGRKMLYQDLYQLTAGEFILFDNYNDIVRDYYYTYLPYELHGRDIELLSNQFTDVILESLQSVIDLACDRQIVVPLSAGKDSRLIVSGLKHLGYKNITCFSYGRKGQYEVKTASSVANKLGDPWYFIELNHRSQREFFQSSLFKEYLEKYNNLSGSQHIQEVSPVYQLINSGVISKDAIFINGNTGDFISGGHIKQDMMNSTSESAYSYFLGKHYSLWNQFRSEHNDKRIITSLESVLNDRRIEIDFESFYTAYETLEYLGRQSKFIPKMMNTFEYFEYDWMMPLWSNAFLNFWEGVPFEYKLEQKLYNYTILKNNWGNVWKDIPCNNTSIRPLTILLMRNACKAFFLFSDKKKWKEFDNKWFMYWYDPAVIMPFIDYSQHCFNDDSPRSSLSWASKEFLLANGVSLDEIRIT